MELTQVGNRETMRPENEDLLTNGTLSPRVKLEPLIGRWPLWPHLVPPAQFAMNLAFRLLPSLHSFAANPTVHAVAARDPRLFGGPFVALSEDDRSAVLEMIDEATAKWQHLIDFANDLKSFDTKLQSTATGNSLDSAYAELPESLAGLVEVVYDLNNHPRIKLFEALMYDSAFDNIGSASLCLHVTDDGSRPFFMSTPLLDATNRLFLNVPYTDPVVDELAKSRIVRGVPPSVQELLRRHGCTPKFQADLFTTDEPIRVTPSFCQDGLRIRYFGHACVLLQSREVSVLLDPVTAWQRDDERATLTYCDLPDVIDYVVITHSHQDHLVAETLMQLRKRIGTVIVPPSDRGNLADPSMQLILKRLGVSQVVSLDYFERLPIPSGEIVSVPFTGEHGGLDIASKHCVVVTVANRRIMFMADSDAVDPMLSTRLAERIGPLDALFLGMECCGAPMSWLYGPLLTKPLTRKNDQSRRFSGSNCERAWSAVRALGSRRVFVYAMGQEPWMRHLMGLEYEPGSIQLMEAERLIQRCRNAGLPAERLNGCRELHLQ